MMPNIARSHGYHPDPERPPYRRIALVKTQDYVDAKNQPKPVDPDESGVTIDAKEERDGQ